MMNDSEAFLSLRVALREGQDAGLLPSESDAGRRFHVMVNEIAIPLLRNLVNVLSLEGLPAHLLIAMDEAVPYVGLEITAPHTTLWISPSTPPLALMTSVRGGLYPAYNSDRYVGYRAVTETMLETTLIEQLRLVLSPPMPLF